MTRRVLAVVAAVGLAALARSAAAGEAPPAGEVSLDGYAEWRDGDLLIVDGQRIRLAPGGLFKGRNEARDVASVPLGYEVKVKGRRASDGAVDAREIEARPNGMALFEKQVLRLTDEAESKYRRAGRFFTSGRQSRTVGRLRDSGPEVARVRRIVERVAPPYVEPGRVRVYTIENDEWNAFAMGNYSIYVYTGLLRDMDDDEVAIVLGHELAHATHEHTRRRFAKAMWVQIAALGITAAARDVDDRKQRLIVNLLTQFTAMAMVNGYGRDLEDQADRVGVRYAHEAGYAASRAPNLWRRFARKYGERGKLVNFFFGNHSLASQRAANLEKEIALNYDGAPRLAVSPREHVRSSARVEDAPSKRRAAVAERTGRVREGMTAAEVRGLLGDPARETSYGSRMRWRYEGFTVVFKNGRVLEVRD
jgi:Zn-dependent protease with chaperone function